MDALGNCDGVLEPDIQNGVMIAIGFIGVYIVVVIKNAP